MEKELLKIARESIASGLQGKGPPDLGTVEGRLAGESGAFVTLRTSKGELRGCVGRFEAMGDLARTVQAMARSAAFEDSRFPPLRDRELDDLKIEISVLSPMKKITDPLKEIELGKHGVWVKKGWMSGTYLPDVATEFNLSLEEFMSSLCAHKAGLPGDAWKNDPEVEIFTYTTEHIKE